MGVTAVAEPAVVRAAGKLTGQKQNPSDFSEVLGKTMNTGKTAGRTSVNSRTHPKGQNQEDKPESKQEESKQADSQNPDEQSVQNAVCVTVCTALTASDTTVAAANPAKAASGKAVEGVDIGEQPAVNSPGTEPVVKTILTELGRKSEEIQNALTAPSADQAEPTAEFPAAKAEFPAAKAEFPAAKAEFPAAKAEFPAAVVAENTPGIEQPPATGILATDKGTTEAATAIPSLGTAEKSGNSGSSVSSQAASAPPVDTAVPAVTDPGTAKQDPGQQDPGQGGESGSQGTESTENMGKKEELPSLSTDNQTVQANFRTHIGAQANSQVELQELSAAVDQALERFQTDLQGIKTESSTIRIALEPKELGSLTITLASGVSGVTAKIRTDNPEAANLIGDQVNRMIQSMEAKGVRVENVDVAYAGTAFQDFSGGGGNNPSQQYGGNSTASLISLFAQTTPDPTDVLQNYESGTGYYAAEDGVGKSVEYRV